MSFQEKFINYCKGRTEQNPAQDVCDLFGKDVDRLQNEMCNELRVTRAKFQKEKFLNHIRRRSENFSKSVELLEKIHTAENDEKYRKEYKELFRSAKQK